MERVLWEGLLERSHQQRGAAQAETRGLGAEELLQSAGGARGLRPLDSLRALWLPEPSVRVAHPD